MASKLDLYYGIRKWGPRTISWWLLLSTLWEASFHKWTFQVYTGLTAVVWTGKVSAIPNSLMESVSYIWIIYHDIESCTPSSKVRLLSLTSSFLHSIDMTSSFLHFIDMTFLDLMEVDQNKTTRTLLMVIGYMRHQTYTHFLSRIFKAHDNYYSCRAIISLYTQVAWRMSPQYILNCSLFTVSYTHLTLPTIYSV